MPITLYDLCGADRSLRFSPYCWRVRLALAHKGLSFETVPVPFTGIAEATRGFSKTVPTIEDGGVQVRDSFDIALYLERTYSNGPPLWRDAAAVGMGRLIEATLALHVHPIITRMIALDIHDALSPEDGAYFRRSREARLGQTLEDAQAGVAAMRDRFNQALRPFAMALGEQPWFAGPAPDFRDHIIFGSLQWLGAFHRDLPIDDARLLDWFAGLAAHYGGRDGGRLAGIEATAYTAASHPPDFSP